MPTELAPLSPAWWLQRLYKRLMDRRGAIDFYEAYYRGDHPLPWLAPQAREEFRQILRMTRTNVLGLVCDVTAEGISTVEGFRFGRDGKADDDTWRIWQANNLDSDSDQAFLDAVITGQSYMLAAPTPGKPSVPLVCVEHASQAIVEFQPGSNRRVRAAGLKVWDDDWTGQIHATLYLPDWIVKYQARKPAAGSAEAPPWGERRVAGEDWPARNPVGVVPLVEIPNAPRLRSGGVSQIDDVTDDQDRINKTLADRLITQDFGAFPQKWAAGWPQWQDEQRTIPTPPIRVGRNRMVTTEVPFDQARFGQWDAAPLDPYSLAKREDVKDIAARKRIPADYIVGELVNINGDTLKASRAGYVGMVRQLRRPVAESLEEVMRLARGIAGVATPDDVMMETIFSNPEFRSEGELTDAVIKRRQSGLISLRQALEDLGYTQTQIRTIREELDTEGVDEAARGDATLARVLRAADSAAVGS